ncbi:MAG: YncE family protein, partial [Acidobacteriota bacterium]|nr:YncE family protein [Acidobacteriota bacterium]
LSSLATVVYATETPQAALLILGKSDQSLSIVDPNTLQVIAKLPAGPDPHEVTASDDGKFAYVSNYGGGSFNTITVIDLVAQKTLPVIELGALRGPHGLTFEDGKLWFTVEGSKAIASYDPATQKIDWVLGTGQDRTHMIYVFPGENQIVTTNVSSATVTFIEKKLVPARGPGGPPSGAPPTGPPPAGPPRTDWIETIIPVGQGSEGFDVSPDGQEIWVANAQDGTVSIINVANRKVVQTLDANTRGANRLKFTPDGKRAFISSLGGADLAVFDRANRKEVKRIKLGHGAAGILMQPDGTRAFVACTPDSYVAVIDLKSLEVTGKIIAGKNPDGLAWALRK